MRLAQKFSLSFASLAFIIVVFPALIKQQDPIKVILIGFVASLLSGIVGYLMGKILTHPKANMKPKVRPKPSQKQAASEASPTPLLSSTVDAASSD
jgi:membrane protein YqaA with SNARE-associated domain